MASDAVIIYTEMPEGSTNYKTCLSSSRMPHPVFTYTNQCFSTSNKVLTFSTGQIKIFLFIEKIALLCYVCYVSRPDDIIILQEILILPNLCSVNFSVNLKDSFWRKQRCY